MQPAAGGRGKRGGAHNQDTFRPSDGAEMAYFHGQLYFTRPSSEKLLQVVGQLGRVARRALEKHFALNGGQAFCILTQVVGLLRPFREEVAHLALMRPRGGADEEGHGQVVTQND